MQYLFLSSYSTHCEQEVRLEYNSKGDIIMPPFISLFLLFVIFVCALWFHDAWFPPEGRGYKKKRIHSHDQV